jgi:radical SAM superfamily enzyme YgiQ (UPF0313 family)
MSSRSLYLVNPKSTVPGYFGAEVFEHRSLTPAQGIADLATTTVAAMAPDDWQVSICEEFVEPVDLDTDADFVGITGKITQGARMLALADEFRRRGKTVLVGGPYASLSPEVFRGRCDVLVIGELEGLAEGFFADLEKGNWQSEYVADRPDLSLSPLPRWDLYPNDRALIGCVQTSRGCPFECEFCDVIEYLGRQQRHKPIESILTELDALYELGYRGIFLADDNFTVYRKKAKAILTALRDWNESRTDGPVAFSTQVSIDAARDPEIMRLCAEAGMTWVFIGIETPNEDSLRETKKRQNVGIDLVDQVQVFLDHGISVTGGMIVGFDHDGLDIFQRQYDFAMSLPVPMFSLGALVAPAATPLFDRMRDSGRLIEGGSEVAASPWDTNILPVRMSREELLEGLRWLSNRLYHPADFGRRIVRMIESLGPQRGPFRPGGPKPTETPRAIEKEAMNVVRRLVADGAEERAMWSSIWRATQARPEAGMLVMMSLFRYAQVRCLYDTGQFWEPRVADQSPFATSNEATGAAGLVAIGGGS